MPRGAGVGLYAATLMEWDPAATERGLAERSKGSAIPSTRLCIVVGYESAYMAGACQEHPA